MSEFEAAELKAPVLKIVVTAVTERKGTHNEYVQTRSEAEAERDGKRQYGHVAIPGQEEDEVVVARLVVGAGDYTVEGIVRAGDRRGDRLGDRCGSGAGRIFRGGAMRAE